MPFSMKKAIRKAYGGALGPFCFPMKDEQAKLVEQAIKEQPADIRNRFSTYIGDDKVDGYVRAFITPSRKGINTTDRTEISLITTASVDRDSEIVLPKGLDFKHFKKNPVVPFAHTYGALPVGKADWVKRERNTDPKKDGWAAQTRYLPAPDGWPPGSWFPDAVWHMIASGFLPGKSIGFIPLKMEEVQEDDIKHRPELVSVDWMITAGLVLEYSVAPVPSNPDALQNALQATKTTLPDEIAESMGLILPDFVSEITSDDIELPEQPVSRHTLTCEERISVFKSRLAKEIAEVDVSSMVNRTIDKQRGKV